jgi:hypothetical protein
MQPWVGPGRARTRLRIMRKVIPFGYDKRAAAGCSCEDTAIPTCWQCSNCTVLVGLALGPGDLLQSALGQLQQALAMGLDVHRALAPALFPKRGVGARVGEKEFAALIDEAPGDQGQQISNPRLWAGIDRQSSSSSLANSGANWPRRTRCSGKARAYGLVCSKRNATNERTAHSAWSARPVANWLASTWVPVLRAL